MVISLILTSYCRSQRESGRRRRQGRARCARAVGRLRHQTRRFERRLGNCDLLAHLAAVVAVAVGDGDGHPAPARWRVRVVRDGRCVLVEARDSVRRHVVVPLFHLDAVASLFRAAGRKVHLIFQERWHRRGFGRAVVVLVRATKLDHFHYRTALAGDLLVFHFSRGGHAVVKFLCACLQKWDGIKRFFESDFAWSDCRSINTCHTYRDYQTSGWQHRTRICEVTLGRSEPSPTLTCPRRSDGLAARRISEDFDRAAASSRARNQNAVCAGTSETSETWALCCNTFQGRTSAKIRENLMKFAFEQNKHGCFEKCPVEKYPKKEILRKITNLIEGIEKGAFEKCLVKKYPSMKILQYIKKQIGIQGKI